MTRRLAALAAALLVALAALGAVAPARAWATNVGETFTGKISVGGSQVDCTYKVLSLPEGTSPGTVQVGDGNNCAINRSTAGALVIPDKVEHDGGDYTVTALGDYCFSFCMSLTSTGLATNSTVTTLGEDCFYSCYYLTSTGLAGNSKVTSLGKYCFAICERLTDTGLATNSTVTSLGDDCFSFCTSLTNASLGSGLTSAPPDPFNSCTALATVYFAGPSSSAEGITLPHDVDCYHLASDASWSGKSKSDVSTNCKSLKALSQLLVTGGTYSGSPASPWSSAVKDETLWAEGETVNVTASQPKTGYKVGWTSSDAGGSFAAASATSTTYTFGPSAGSGTTTLAGATPVSYEVRFDKNSADAAGTMADEGMTYDAEKALSANAFSRAGYHLTGWNTASDGSGTSYAGGASVKNLSSTAGATVTLFAQWAEDDPVTISYSAAGGGTVSRASESVRPATGTASGCTATPAAGYHFVNWTKDGVEVSTDAAFAPARVGGLNVAATYTANFAEDADVTIGYSAGTGGTVSAASEQVAPATGTASGCTATPAAGYHLVNWTDASGKEVSTDATLVPAKPAGGAYVAATYTANFAGNAYTVAFDPNGGSGTMPDQAMTYGTPAALSANAYSRGGHAFSGWNTKADGTGAAYADAATVSDLAAEAGATVTLYAQWAATAMPATPASAAASAASATASPQTGDATPAGAACALAAAGLAALALGRRLLGR